MAISQIKDSYSNFRGISFLQAKRYQTGGNETTISFSLDRMSFDQYHPMILYGAYRSAGDTNYDGIAIIKFNAGVAYIVKKQGFAGLTNVSYNASNRTITFTCGTYMSLILIGINDSFL